MIIYYVPYGTRMGFFKSTFEVPWTTKSASSCGWIVPGTYEDFE